ncbi:MAG: Glu/Leu/Phe/Val family dehydrogenase [Bacillota bacterium]
MIIFDYMENFDYENLYFCQDKSVGLKAVIALHDTTLGPATGGCRMWTYGREEDAIEDALRLARGMTYKYAAAGVNLGGGKAVVIGDPKTQKSEALFRALGRFINILNGRYITGEDVGTTLEDMEYIRMETPYVVTLPEYLGGAGPISPSTAFSTIQALKAAHKHLYGTDALSGKRVAVQGVGSVGYHVVELLAKEGADLVITDIDMERAKAAASEFKAETVAPDKIYEVDCDIFSPCALGAVINDETIPLLKCKIVAGCANNQLKEPRHGDILEQKGIFYVPDYIANAGGTIYDTDRLMYGQHNRERAAKNVARVYQTMEAVIKIAKEQNIPTYLAADRYAERRINEIRKVKNI